jgi:glutamine cyclotransferase
MPYRASAPFTALSLTALVFALVATDALAGPIQVYGYTVVHSYPHDTRAFTEGLFYDSGYLYESTGEPGQSSVRKVELETGKVLTRTDLPATYFGEGIVAWDHRLYQVTWRQQVGIIYDFATLKKTGDFTYAGEGWAMTHDASHIYLSDGTPDIRILDPHTLANVGTIHVTANGRPVNNINELEWVKGEIYANIWQTDVIVRIDPLNGQVVGVIDLHGLFDHASLPDPVDDVPNGIAYDEKHDRLFVTGKRWPKLFEIKLKAPSAP